ncbi:MAG: hypothetical protein ACK5MP_10790 [Nostocoides sp.]
MTRARHQRIALCVSGIALVGAVVGGCSGGSASGLATTTPVNDGAPLALADMPEVWAAYDAANNKAMSASYPPRYATAGWRAVATEVVLDGGRLLHHGAEVREVDR